MKQAAESKKHKKNDKEEKMRDRAEKLRKRAMHEKMKDDAGKMPKGEEEGDEEELAPIKKKRLNPLGMAQEQAAATDQFRCDRATDMIAKQELQRSSRGSIKRSKEPLIASKLRQWWLKKCVPTEQFLLRWSIRSVNARSTNFSEMSIQESDHVEADHHWPTDASNTRGEVFERVRPQVY